MSELENSAALVATKPLNGDEPIAISYGPKSNSKLLGIPREPHVVLCCVVGLSGLLAILGYQGGLTPSILPVSFWPSSFFVEPTL